MVSLKEFSELISTIRRVGFGDIITADDSNKITKAIQMLNSFYPCNNMSYIIRKMRFVKTGDIIKPEDHNLKVDAIKAFRDCISPVTNTEKLDKDLTKLRYVKNGEYVLTSDNNNIIDCLNDILELLPIMPHPYFTLQHDFKRTGYQNQPYSYIFATNLNGYLYCYKKDGSLLFSFPLGQASSNEPIISIKRNIYISTGVSSGLPTLQKINMTPSQLWSVTLHGFSTGTPSFDYNNNIYVVDNGTYLTKITEDGIIEWSLQIGGANLNTRYITTVIDKDNIIYTGDCQTNVCAVRDDGTYEWKLTLPNWSEYTALDYDNYQFYIISGGLTNRSILYSIDLNGSINWEFQTPIGYLCGMSIAKDGTIYLAGGDNNKIYALDVDGNLKWEFTTGNGVYTIPAISPDNTIYSYCWDGYLYALDEYGNLKWKTFIGTYHITYPVIGNDGIIYTPYGTYGVSLCAISPDGQILWTTPSVGNTFQFGVSIA